MQTKNSSEHMIAKSIYQQLVTIHQLYKAHFVEIRMGARQGRLWTLQAFQKALDGAGLESKLIGEHEGNPDEPRMGDYLLLVEDAFLIDIAYNRQLITDKNSNRVPRALIGKVWIIFNFGGHAPEYMSPYDDRVEQDDDDDSDSWLDENA